MSTYEAIASKTQLSWHTQEPQHGYCQEAMASAARLGLQLERYWFELARNSQRLGGVGVALCAEA